MPQAQIYELYPKSSHPEGAIITPEGYNVRDYEDARAYIEEVCGLVIPDIKCEQDVFDVLKTEMRAAKYADGTHENVYDHTMDLVDICMTDPAILNPKLDKNLIRLMAETHDWPEAIYKDTVITDEEEMLRKEYGEEAGWTILKHLLPDSPRMRALTAYRECEETGIWTPEAAFVKTRDKIQAYKFQLRDDVRATLHRERGEEFEDIVRMTFPKVAMDPSAALLLKSTFLNLGAKWEFWDCKEIESDYETIVEYHMFHANWQHMAKITDEKLAASSLARVYEFKQKTEEEAVAQRILEPEDVKEFGKRVVLLDSRRDRPTPPPPPSGPIFPVPDSASFAA